MDGLRVGAGIFNYHLKQKLTGGLQPAEYIRGISNAYTVNKIGSIWMASSPDFTFEFNERTGEFRLQVIGKATWRGKAGFTRKTLKRMYWKLAGMSTCIAPNPRGSGRSVMVQGLLWECRRNAWCDGELLFNAGKNCYCVTKEYFAQSSQRERRIKEAGCHAKGKGRLRVEAVVLRD